MRVCTYCPDPANQRFRLIVYQIRKRYFKQIHISFKKPTSKKLCWIKEPITFVINESNGQDKEKNQVIGTLITSKNRCTNLK